MDTPLLDFVRAYADSGTIRAHMPGHKGKGPLGAEALDLTEIFGADSLYEASGIIAQSENNASSLFGSRMTFYSAEGSSLCIRAMTALALKQGLAEGRSRVMLCGRNAHKALLSAACLLDVQLRWLPAGEKNYLTAQPDAQTVEKALNGLKEPPFAVYLTSPDYLGGMADIRAIAQVCRAHDVPLLVDNAHGAYLHFLPEPLHPLDLGAQVCCDSAHKTLPALTGAALMHFGAGTDVNEGDVRDCLALFGSTSPSYLILASLDGVNRYLSDGYRDRLRAFCAQMDAVKARLQREGWELFGQEPMKLTVCASRAGLTGQELSQKLRDRGIECEFADPDYTVLMLTPEQTELLPKVESALLAVPRGKALRPGPPKSFAGERALSVREAMLSPSLQVPVSQALGRVLASPCVSCPPAVPILMCGERVTQEAIEAFHYYHIDTVRVVRED